MKEKTFYLIEAGINGIELISSDTFLALECLENGEKVYKLTGVLETNKKEVIEELMP